MKGFEVTLENLQSPYYEIAMACGLDNAIKMEEIFRGQQVYFKSFQKMYANEIKEKILTDFNGYNVQELSEKYGYTPRHIRRICQKKYN